MTELSSLNTQDLTAHYRDAYVFFRKKSELSDETKAAIALFTSWHAMQVSFDEGMTKVHGNTQGLIHHIRSVHGWLDDSKDMRRKRGETDNYELSSIETGKAVEAQLADINAGKIIENILPHTENIVIDFYERQWLPLAFQTPLWINNSSGTVRTQADILVYDIPHQRFALIELKTGYSNVTYNFVRKARGECDYFAKTMRIMCHLQLGWMYLSLALTHSQFPFDAYVVRVGAKSGVQHPEPLDDAVLLYYMNDYVTNDIASPAWFDEALVGSFTRLQEQRQTQVLNQQV